MLSKTGLEKLKNNVCIKQNGIKPWPRPPVGKLPIIYPFPINFESFLSIIYKNSVPVKAHATAARSEEHNKR